MTEKEILEIKFECLRIAKEYSKSVDELIKNANELHNFIVKSSI